MSYWPCNQATVHTMHVLSLAMSVLHCVLPVVLAAVPLAVVQNYTMKYTYTDIVVVTD